MTSGDRLQPTPLHTARLDLEPLRVEHAAEMTAVLADPEIYRFTGGQPPTVVELREQYRRQVQGRSSDGTEQWLNWVIRRTADGQAVGYVQATITGAPTGQRAEVAWVVGVLYQRQGFATESVTAMTQWLRSQGISELIAHVHPGHQASEAVARSIGLFATGELLDGEVRWANRARAERA